MNFAHHARTLSVMMAKDFQCVANFKLADDRTFEESSTVANWVAQDRDLNDSSDPVTSRIGTAASD
jgi:hypothetical protein